MTNKSECCEDLIGGKAISIVGIVDDVKDLQGHISMRTPLRHPDSNLFEIYEAQELTVSALQPAPHLDFIQSLFFEIEFQIGNEIGSRWQIEFKDIIEFWDKG